MASPTSMKIAALMRSKKDYRISRLPPVHQKARTVPYPDGQMRFKVSDVFVPWMKMCPDYNPVEYDAPSVKAGPVWADDPAKLADGEIAFNTLDGKINRVSHVCEYLIDVISNMPMNPKGRTGMTGRGLLGRYGPNHAADPIVTRWMRGDDGKILLNEFNKPRLEFVAVKRKDNGEWAIPGGMVEAGDTVSLTLRKEFGEEALNTLELSQKDREIALGQIRKLFMSGIEVYKGYVDDPRNTDNAWMETIAVNYHDVKGDLTSNFKLAAGDDAGDVAWVEITPELKLYASHELFVMTVYDALCDSIDKRM